MLISFLFHFRTKYISTYWNRRWSSGWEWKRKHRCRKMLFQGGSWEFHIKVQRVSMAVLFLINYVNTCFSAGAYLGDRMFLDIYSEVWIYRSHGKNEYRRLTISSSKPAQMFGILVNWLSNIGKVLSKEIQPVKNSR